MRRAYPGAQTLRFVTASRDRHTDSCEKVHPPKQKCTSHYSAVHSQMGQFAFGYSGVRKNVCIYRPSADLLRAKKQARFTIQFLTIDTTFLTRGLRTSKQNLRFATALGDRHHIFDETVAHEQTKFAFRYNFGRSTPFLTRGLRTSKFAFRYSFGRSTRRF